MFGHRRDDQLTNLRFKNELMKNLMEYEMRFLFFVTFPITYVELFLVTKKE